MKVPPHLRDLAIRALDQLRTRPVKIGVVVLTALVSCYALIEARPSDVGATPAADKPPPLPAAPDPVASAPAAPPEPTTAQILFNTVPPSKALVYWGKKKLGKIEPNKPLVVVRPRDSGPLDVTVRAEGFLPVHTRAHTFSDSKVLVRLTAPDQTITLLGYRVPLDAGAPVVLEQTMLDGGTGTNGTNGTSYPIPGQPPVSGQPPGTLP